MSSIDTAIEITEYCLKQSRKNRVDWYSDSFISNSYSIWAAKELLTRLNNNRDIPPLITLENFEELMDEYACKNINNSFLFSCAKDMTRWIIDLLIAWIYYQVPKSKSNRLGGRLCTSQKMLWYRIQHIIRVKLD